MKLNFNGIDLERKWVLDRLVKRICYHDGNEYNVYFKRGSHIKVTKTGLDLYVECGKTCEAGRGLLLAVQLIKNGVDTSISEKAQFRSMGIMLDMSRGGVMNVSKAKEYMEYLALLGMNTIYLYMEDVYEVDGYPYFGYLRGRYTHEELKEMDTYGAHLGLEVIPCIQALGHFEQYLKWREAAEVKDTDKVLLAGAQKTYALIEDLVKTVSDCFTTRKIHLGLDESFDLGLGKYLQKNGYRYSADIFAQHLSKIKEITSKFGLEPIVWGDMYFTFGADLDGAYNPNANIPEVAKELFPEGFSITYWDYYHTEQSYYEAMIDKHREISENLLFAGGIWTWNGLVPDYHKTVATCNAAMAACKNKKVKDIFATVWGDDGCETDYMFSLPGAALFAEHAYHHSVNSQSLDEKMELLFQTDFQSFYRMGEIAHPIQENSLSVKRILYSDILVGVIDEDIQDESLVACYKDLYEYYMSLKREDSYFHNHFDYMACICRAVMNKIQVAIRLQRQENLSDIRDVLLPVLKQDFKSLKNAHRELWYQTYKPFGFEVMDGRYGAIVSRIDTAIYRLDELLQGKIRSLQELEEKRLPYGDLHKWCNSYVGISSAYLSKGC